MSAASATATGPRLLLAEDEPELAAMLIELLTSEGYRVDAVRDGQTALQHALNETHDLALLDRGLPFVQGLELLARLRGSGWSIPVLILSAYGSPRDRVAGLDAGAEDYLSKPFDVDELLARLRSLLRRHADAAHLLQVPGGVFDPAARTVVPRPEAGSVVELSDRESVLLAVLASRPERVFSRDELVSRVFPDAEAASVVDTYVHYLRRKLGPAAVRTVRGVGYQLGRVRPSGGVLVEK